MNKLKIKKSEKRLKDEKSEFLYLLKGTVMAYFITFVAFLVYGIFLTYFENTGQNLQLVVMITTVVSVFISGFISSKGAKSKGIFFGMLSGVIYIVIMGMISFCILPKVVLSLKSIMMSVLAICGGGLGGIIGINTKK